MKKMRFEHDKKQFAVKRRFHNALSLLFFCFFAIYFGPKLLQYISFV